MHNSREQKIEELRHRTSEWLAKPGAKEFMRSRGPAAIVNGKPWCNCDWEQLDDTFKRCKKCGVFMCYRVHAIKTFDDWPKVLEGRILPPTINVFCDFVVSDNLVRLRQSKDKPLRYHLLVRFPKRWLVSGMFSALDWPRVSAAIRPALKSKDPVIIYRAVQNVTVGFLWSRAEDLSPHF